MSGIEREDSRSVSDILIRILRFLLLILGFCSIFILFRTESHAQELEESNNGFDEYIYNESIDSDADDSGVDCVSADGIDLSESEVVFEEYGTVFLHTTIYPEESVSEVIWLSSNTNVVQVVNGCLNPVSRGEADVRALVQNPDGSVVEAMCHVIVNYDAPAPSYAQVYVEPEPEEPEVAENVDEFLAQPLLVDRFQFELFKLLKFFEIATCIISAQLFILIMKRGRE